MFGLGKFLCIIRESKISKQQGGPLRIIFLFFIFDIYICYIKSYNGIIWKSRNQIFQLNKGLNQTGVSTSDHLYQKD